MHKNIRSYIHVIIQNMNAHHHDIHTYIHDGDMVIRHDTRLKK